MNMLLGVIWLLASSVHAQFMTINRARPSNTPQMIPGPSPISGVNNEPMFSILAVATATATNTIEILVTRTAIQTATSIERVKSTSMIQVTSTKEEFSSVEPTKTSKDPEESSTDDHTQDTTESDSNTRTSIIRTQFPTFSVDPNESEIAPGATMTAPTRLIPRRRISAESSANTKLVNNAMTLLISLLVIVMLMF